MKPHTSVCLVTIATGLLVSPCRADGFLGLFGKKEEKALPEQAELNRREGEASALAARAAAAEAKGDSSQAAKLYAEIVEDFPISTLAPDAAIRAGELYQSVGKAEKSFENYQAFITRFKGDKRYKQVLDRQFALAMACKEGQFTGRMLGLPVGVSRNETIELLETVASNVPRSSMAGQALLVVAELHKQAGNLPKAVASYEKVVDEMPGTKEAADAQFQIAQTYQAKAEQKSKDRTTVTTARRSYEDYLLQNPGGEKAGEARRQIGALSGKEAKETFEIAKFYERTGKPQAAAIYYREVLGYDDPALAAEARQRLDALGASGVTAPVIPDDPLGFPEDARTKDRDDYAGPPVPDLRPRLPSLRYLDIDTLPEGDLPPGGGNPLLDEGPLPPVEPPPPGPETPEDVAPPAAPPPAQ
ncbi:MAG: outer membrane protein assembly factor BamD [Verrucomicrobiales bacterium]